MYQAYWGLSQSPFRGHLDPGYFHQGPAQEEALARLQFLVDESRALGLLLGEAGSGKSMLLEIFAAGLGHVERQWALVNLAALDTHELLWLLCSQLGVEAPSTASPFALWRGLTDHLTANRYQQIATVLLLDDADLARDEAIDQIVRLAQLDASREGRLTIIVAARRERLCQLGTRLLELADLRIDLDVWESDDTAEFVKKSLALAGRTTPLFSEAALARLHELSAGIPRHVKQLADLALLAGAGGNLAQIEPDTIEAVFRELGTPAVEPPRTEIARK